MEADAREEVIVCDVNPSEIVVSDTNLWYAGTRLHGTEWSLPQTPTSHDLADQLIACVFRMKQDGAAGLSVAVVSSVVTDELRRLHSSKKHMAELLGASQKSFSKLVHCTKVWSSASNLMKRLAFDLFKWLNLDLGDRLSVLYSILDEMDESALGTVPPTDKLAIAVRTEMLKRNISLEDLANCVLYISDSALLNLLSAPLPWGITPMRMKVVYARLWNWMKLPREKRLGIFRQSFFDHPRRRLFFKQIPDTERLCAKVRALVQGVGVSEFAFAATVLGDASALGLELIRAPKSWPSTNSLERKVYICLMRWASMPLEERQAPFAKFVKQDVCEESIDPVEVAELVLREMETSELTTKKLASAFGVTHACMSALLFYPVRWEECTKLHMRIYSGCRALLRIGADKREDFLRSLTYFPKSGEGHVRQRSKFTPEQLAGLKESFLLNEKPNSAEKLQLSERLGLPLKTITTYFCNQRKRVQAREAAHCKSLMKKPQ